MSANPTQKEANKQKQSSLASPLNEDLEMISDTASSDSHVLVREEPEIGAI